MRVMRCAVVRHAFTAFSLVSLLLCAAACMLWGLSHMNGDVELVLSDTPGRAIDFQHGVASLGVDVDGFHQPWEDNWNHSWLGFGAGGVRYSAFVDVNGDAIFAQRYMRWWSMPMWFAALVTSVPPVVWVTRTTRRHRRERRAARGLCAQCGYDLRAHSRDARCPECGAGCDGGG
jgi:hypothetical protein